MFTLILCFLYTVSAQTLTPPYSRMYLRGMKRIENERITEEFINRGITYLENAVFTAAKQGHLRYRSEPFEGCEAYSIPNDDYSFDKEICKNIVNGIQKLVSERFPDSEILYNPKTKRYILKWD
jgi:hypothetical protein